MFQNGDWPWWDDEETEDDEDKARERNSRDGLANLLRSTGESSVELYGVWDGGPNFGPPPRIREEISLEEILKREFRFKQEGFYIVHVQAI
jgi:hypothetical protein